MPRVVFSITMTKTENTSPRPRAVIFDFFGVVFDPRVGDVRAGLTEFLQILKRHNIGCGIASSTGSDHIAAFLKEHDLDRYFSTIVGSDQVMMMKPDPECYQRVAEFFQAKPQECLVIDDSRQAITNATAAKFQTIYFGDGLDTFEKIAMLFHL